MLEKKIENLGKRYITNGVYKDFKYVKVFIPLDWDIKDSYGNINAQRDINTPTQVVFGSDTTSISFSDIIDVILECIKPYLAIEEKNNLFNELIDKLEIIFAENDLETLKTLKFDFNGKQKRPYNKSKVPSEIIADKRELLVENEDLTNSKIEIPNTSK